MDVRVASLHPLENPRKHIGIEMLSVPEIVERLKSVLLVLSLSK